MAVESVDPGFVHDLVKRIGEARVRALEGFERMPEPGASGEAAYWEGVLEANAARVLDVLALTRLGPGLVVRYRFYENRHGDLHIRPFVTRAGSEVDDVKRLLDWHPPPDAQRRSGLLANNRDADLLYRHFTLTRTAEGVFEYWFAMQEIWASTYWAHARVIATAQELTELLARPNWQSERDVEHCAPVVVTDAERQSSNLAVLVYSPIGHESVALEQIEIGPDQVIRYGESLPVAAGPRGYLL